MKNDKLGRTSSSSDLTEESPDIFVRFSRGLEHLRNAEVNKAKQVFDEIINEDPEYAPAFFGLSCVQIRLDAKELALKFLERALELDPRYGEAHLVMARLLYEDGDFVGGYEHVNKAVQFGVSLNTGNVLIDEFLTNKSKVDIADIELQTEPSTKVVADIQSIPLSKENIRGRILSRITELLLVKINGSSGKDYYLISSFFLALFVRLVVIWIIPIDWKSVSYHLWQIGHFTLQIGLSKGRMWDLHGVEYLYPILPSLVQSFLMWLFRTSSIIPFRVLNIILSSITTSLVYLIGKRHLSQYNAFLAAIFCAVFPGILIWNVINLYETMACFFFLFALYKWEKSSFVTGILLGLAAQSRVEFWVITFGACLAPLFYEKDNKIEKFLPIFGGWLTIMVPFMIIFQFHTGNFLYPVYYGMFGGFGFSVLDLSKFAYPFLNQQWRPFWLLWVIISTSLLLYFIKNKPNTYQLYVSYLGLVLFHGIQDSLFPISPFIRLFYWDYISDIYPLTSKYFLTDFVMLSLIIPLVPHFKRIKIKREHVQIAVILLSIISLFIVIPKIQNRMVRFQTPQEIQIIIDNYDDGAIICDSVYITYLLSNQPYNIPAKNILGSFYSPIYYGLKDIESLKSWLVNNDVTLILDTKLQKADQIMDIIQREAPEMLTHLGGIVYKINYS